jgi:hypothetical protein
MSISINEAWKQLFNKHQIVRHIEEEGIFQITASEINTVKEARLMAKFDQSEQLPKVFREYDLAILPITRGEYVIGHFDAYLPISYPSHKPTPIRVPDLETLDYTNLYSEASALLFAYNSGIISDIMGDDDIHFTVNGRMASGQFDYAVRNTLNPNRPYPIQVRNTQVEIDAGYEGPEKFCICEAKNVAVGEILVRQLYYPYRLWTSKISKTIQPVFLVYSNDVFYAFVCEFTDLNDYNSLQVVESKSYTFADEIITFTEVIELWKSITPTSEPDITFPQADKFERVIDLLSVLFENDLSRDEVTLKYEFAERQTNYYIDACRYLSLVEKYQTAENPVMYRLTPEARRMMNLRYKAKYLSFIRCILKMPVFHKVFGVAIQDAHTPPKSIIREMMAQAGLSLNETTLDRRTSTVRGWMDWIFNQCEM